MRFIFHSHPLICSSHPSFYISPWLNKWSIFRLHWAWPQGTWYSGYDVVCLLGWAVTKIIPLPSGPSIVPLHQAKPTLGNPLKCLFGPVDGALHLTDMMRKGKRHLCWLSLTDFDSLGVQPVAFLQWWHWGGSKGASHPLATAPPTRRPAQECQG